MLLSCECIGVLNGTNKQRQGIQSKREERIEKMEHTYPIVTIPDTIRTLRHEVRSSRISIIWNRIPTCYSGASSWSQLRSTTMISSAHFYSHHEKKDHFKSSCQRKHGNDLQERKLPRPHLLDRCVDVLGESWGEDVAERRE